MVEKYKNKYRVKSHRLEGWDYSDNGYYFVTLVTQNRQCNLGEIVKDGMVLSKMGKIIDDEWNKSFEIRSELFLDRYVVMPNHLHAIIILENTRCRDTRPCVSRKPKSISSFIAGYKSAVNSKIDDFIDENNLNIPKYNHNNHFFQSNYYDHIIRNENDYIQILQYIIDNPTKWALDKLNASQHAETHGRVPLRGEGTGVIPVSVLETNKILPP